MSASSLSAPPSNSVPPSGAPSSAVPTGAAPDAAAPENRRAEPFACPFCGETDLRPQEGDRWHCRACLRLFTVSFHGLLRPPAPPPAAPTPRTGHDPVMLGPLISRPEDVAAALEEDPVAFAQLANSVLDGADPLTILGWAGRAFGKSLAVTASMGDTVLAHLASRAVPGVDVLFVDTGYHFAETLGTVDAVAATYPVRMLSITPKQSKADHEAERGELFRTDPDKCCALRKVAPLNDALRGYRAWATGLRRDDSLDRACTPTVQWDAKRGLLKLAPIAPWTDEDVEAYVAEHPDTLMNPLLQLGYRSIGCAPCTRAVAPGESARAGRWAGLAKTECGIHI